MRERPAPPVWALTVALALPLLAAVVTAALLGQPAGADATGILERAAVISWGADDLSWAPGTFAPILPAIAAAAGESPWAPATVAALVVAGALATGLQAARRAGWTGTAAAALAAPVLASPAVLRSVTQVPAQTVSLALQAAALGAVARFTTRQSLPALVTASLLLSVSLFTAPGAWAGVAGVGLAAAWLAREHLPRSPRVGPGLLAILLFPSAAASMFWVFLTWWFTSAPGTAVSQLLPSAPTATAATWVGAVAGLPLLVWALWRAPRTAAVPALTALAGLGWVSPGAETGFVAVTATALALLAVTGRPPRPAMVWCVAVAQVIAGAAVVLA